MQADKIKLVEAKKTKQKQIKQNRSKLNIKRKI